MEYVREQGMNVRRFTYYSDGKPIVQGGSSLPVPVPETVPPPIGGQYQQEREEIGELVGVVS
jgi:hypothetical protein